MKNKELMKVIAATIFTTFILGAVSIFIKNSGSDIYSIGLNAVYFLGTIICVFLATRKKISTYVWGAISIPPMIILPLLAYDINGYLGIWFFTNLLVYLPLQLYGVLNWDKISTDSVHTKSLKMSRKDVIVATIIGISSALIFGLLFRYMGWSNPILNGFGFAFPLIAMYMMVKSYSVQWVFWTITNVITIVLYLIPTLSGGTSMVLPTICYIILLINSIYGIYNWRRIEG